MGKITFILLIICTSSFAQNNKLSVDEYIFYYTTRINCVYNVNGKLVTGSGTGFFFDFDTILNQSIPVIITNRHVIENAVIGQFSLIRANKFGLPDTSVITITLNNFKKYWIDHPDTSVDLCLMPIAPLVNEARKKKIDFFYIPISRKFIPSKTDWKELKAIENIKMVGYPIGLSDTINHLPIIRSGVTATPPYYDYNGSKMFMIDSPCFPGSSGSPILVYDIGNTSDKRGLLMYATKIYLLGILFAGPQMNVKGEIKLQNIPVTKQPYTDSRIPINLGYVIKSDRILEFEKILINK